MDCFGPEDCLEEEWEIPEELFWAGLEDWLCSGKEAR